MTSPNCTVEIETSHLEMVPTVKDATDIESGRLEYFKQMLTIGLAAIAGLAAIFTDPDKVPDGRWRIGALCLFALAAIAVVAYSSMGISSYANYLRCLWKLSKSPEDAQLKNRQNRLAEGVIWHAKATLIASWIAVFSLVAFAILMLFGPPTTGPEAAMTVAKQIVNKQPGNPSVNALDTFRTEGNDYVVTYVTTPGMVKYSVRVDRNTNSVLEITKL